MYFKYTNYKGIFLIQNYLKYTNKSYGYTGISSLF